MAIPNLMSLDELRTKTKLSVVGQDHVVDAVTSCIYMHFYHALGVEFNILSNRNKGNLLLMGNSGTGKTFVIREVMEHIDVPLFEINAKSITLEGWHGTSFIDLLKENLTRVKDHPMRYGAVIFIDEFDKMCMPTISSSGVDWAIQSQTSILKYLEGAVTNIPGIGELNTVNFCFILGGSFTELFKYDHDSIGFNNEKSTTNKIVTTEELIKFGMIPEIAGRINRVITTNPITEDVFRNILNNDSFIFNQWLNLFQELDIDASLNISLEEIIAESVKSNLGVRKLIQLLNQQLDLIIENNIDKIKFNEAYCKLFHSNL